MGGQVLTGETVRLYLGTALRKDEKIRGTVSPGAGARLAVRRGVPGSFSWRPESLWRPVSSRVVSRGVSGRRGAPPPHTTGRRCLGGRQRVGRAS